MKKYILLLLLIVVTISQAQERTADNPNPYTSGVDEKLALLDKSDVSTQILYDRVFPFANLENFNQTQVDTSQVHHYMAAYAELQVADYSNRFNTITQLKTNVANTLQTKYP